MSNVDISKIWPGWEIEGKPLGRGSYGVVYKIVRRGYDMESYAAVKVITIPQNESEVDTLIAEGLSKEATKSYLEEVVRDFISEIRLMESFKGVQNIVSVEDYEVVEKEDEIGWVIYIRMELLTPFYTYIKGKTLSEREVIKLGTDICSALELCEQRNVIHRDIKPQNIFVNQFGHFKLGDFGIARTLENVTSGLSQKGSPYYMAPEVARGTRYDSTVDIYSLGIVLYQLLNKNRLPFLDTERQMMNPNERIKALNRRMEGELLPAPCEASPAVAEVILIACDPKPSKRFCSAQEMKAALISASGDILPQNHFSEKREEEHRVHENPAPDIDDRDLSEDLNRTVLLHPSDSRESISADIYRSDTAYSSPMEKQEGSPEKKERRKFGKVAVTRIFSALVYALMARSVITVVLLIATTGADHPTSTVPWYVDILLMLAAVIWMIFSTKMQ